MDIRRAVADNQLDKNRVMDELRWVCAEVLEFIQSRGLARAEEGDEEFGRLALRLFSFQYKHNLPYQAYCQRLKKNPGQVEHWREIPAVVTSAFKELELTVLPPEARTRTFISSGTTQKDRSRHFHGVETLRVYEASLERWFKPFVLPDRAEARFLRLIPALEEAPDSSLAHMMERVALAFGSELYLAKPLEEPVERGRNQIAGYIDRQGAWQTDMEIMASFASLASESEEPVVICGTAFSLVHLCDYLAERKQILKFPAGSRAFETGGYKGRSREVPKEELHQMISRWLGIPERWIVSEYGMSELSSQAYDRVAGEEGPRLFRFPPWARWEIISPETGRPASVGETGLLRVWDLANAGSVAVIQTEDLATRLEGGFTLAGRAGGAAARGCSLRNA